jgi:hypothetical protein
VVTLVLKINFNNATHNNPWKLAQDISKNNVPSFLDVNQNSIWKYIWFSNDAGSYLNTINSK